LGKIMAQKDAIIRNLEHTLEDKEREIELMKDALDNAGAPDREKMRELDQKIRELQSLVKGLTEELLDLKTVVMKMQEERTPKMPRTPPQKVAPLQKPAAEAPKAEVARAAPVPASKARARQEDDMELIMQTDGTLKPEKKQSEGVIVADNRSGKRPVYKKKTGRIELEEDESTPLIYANEDDTVEIKRK
jgi:hypothetical protein